MLLIVHQCFLMMLSRKIIVRKATLQQAFLFLKLFYKFFEYVIYYYLDFPYKYDNIILDFIYHK